MPPRIYKLIISRCFMIGMSLSCYHLYGDFISLTNGSRLYCVIKKIDKNRVYIKTDFIGDPVIGLEKVNGISTDTEINFRLVDGTAFWGRLVARNDREVLLVDGIEQMVDLSAIATLWRTGEREPPGLKKRVKWDYQAAFDISGRKGNTDRFGTAGDFNAELSYSDLRLGLFISGDRAVDDGKKTSSEYKAGLDFEIQSRKRHSGFINFEVEHDEIEAIDLRLTTVLGYGHYFINSDRHQFRGRVGSDLRYEVFDQGGSDTSPGIKIGLYNFLKLNSLLSLKNDLTHSQSIVDSDDYRSVHVSSLEWPLDRARRWNLRLGVTNEFNNTAATNASRLESKYFAKLVIKWE